MNDGEKTMEQLTQEIETARHINSELSGERIELLSRVALMQKRMTHLEAALEDGEVGVWIWRVRNGEVYFSSTWERMLDYDSEEIERNIHAWERMVHPEDRPDIIERLNRYLAGDLDDSSMEYRMLTKKGKWKWIHFCGRVLERDEEGKPLLMGGVQTDISRLHEIEEEKRQLEEGLLSAATRDILTGTLNRQYFEKKLVNEMDRATRYNLPLSLIKFDLDDFKEINDTLGHNEGNRIIEEMAALARQHIRSDDLIARWGGNRFMVLTYDDGRTALALAERLRLLIEKHVFNSGCSVTASFGVAEYEYGTSMEYFTHQTTMAIRKAKQSGKNVVKSPSDEDDD